MHDRRELRRDAVEGKTLTGRFCPVPKWPSLGVLWREDYLASSPLDSVVE